uniref:Uncharacterized protein n=1 Tax=Arundo donax TaxID=35708 RepID=A0A0A9C3F8_ARUDO
MMVFHETMSFISMPLNTKCAASTCSNLAYMPMREFSMLMLGKAPILIKCPWIPSPFFRDPEMVQL